MPKAPKIPVPAEAEGLSIPGEAVAEPKAEKKAKKTSFSVYQDGEFVRTYSVEVHGPEAEALANEFAAQNPARDIR